MANAIELSQILRREIRLLISTVRIVHSEEAQNNECIL